MATNDQNPASYTPKVYTRFADKSYCASEVFWEDWLERWEGLKIATEMVSWLHIIFETRPRRDRGFWPQDIGQRVKREQILLCADIAKEYWRCRDIDASKPAWEPAGQNEVVFKAISMLVSNFFNVKKGDEGAFSWFSNKGCFIIHEEVLPAIIEIFHGGPIRDYSIPRYVKEHEREALKNFLTFVMMLAWQDNIEGERVLSDEQKKLLQGMRQKFIKILVDIGEVRRLLSVRGAISIEDIKTLRRIVFRPDFHGRVPSCTGEILGLYGRDDAAETLLILESSLGFASKKQRKIDRLTNRRVSLRSEIEAMRENHREISSAIAFCKKNGNSSEDIARMEGDLMKLRKRFESLSSECEDVEIKLRELSR